MKRVKRWRRFFFRMLILMTIGAFLVDKFYLTDNVLSGVEYEAKKEAKSGFAKEASAKELTPEIIERMKSDIIAKLKEAETHGQDIKEGEMFYTNDPTTKMRGVCLAIGGKRPISCDSFGPLQMKIPTIQGWYKELYGKEVTEIEAFNIAEDMKSAAPLATDAIVRIPGAIYAWTGAKNEKEFYDYVIPLIREYEAR